MITEKAHLSSEGKRFPSILFFLHRLGRVRFFPSDSDPPSSPSPERRPSALRSLSIPRCMPELSITTIFDVFIKMGGVFAKDYSPLNSLPVSKLEAKMAEAMQKRASQGTSMRSFNTVILKFPKIDENLRKCKTIFKEFDEDSNGAIDQAELKRCFNKLETSFSEEEITELFEACDINEDMGIKFNEFIVLLCLIHLLQEPAALQAKSRMGLQSLEATFEILIDAFVFLDKNKDGYVSKNEMIDVINETTSGGRSSGQIAMKRFEEMDWDKNGTVTFKEFLFAFTYWVGIDELEDEDE